MCSFRPIKRSKTANPKSIQRIILLFVHIKEMTKKTRHTKKRSSRRKTLRRRKTRRGGAFSIPDTGHSQKIVMPTSSFGKDIGTPVNADNDQYGI
jgi:hypothetical protein